jgi:hypothetical protein
LLASTGQAQGPLDADFVEEVLQIVQLEIDNTDLSEILEEVRLN